MVKSKKAQITAKPLIHTFAPPTAIDVPLDYANRVIRQWNFLMFCAASHPFAANLQQLALGAQAGLAISSDQIVNALPFAQSARTLHVLAFNPLAQATLNAYFDSFSDWLDQIEQRWLLNLNLDDVDSECLGRVMRSLEAWQQHPRDWNLSLHSPKQAKMLLGKLPKPKATLTASWVYFIQAIGHPSIKIGVTRNIDNRLIALQTASPFPLEVVAVIQGDRSLERQLHQRFAPYRTSGEWFRLEGELEQYLHQLLFIQSKT